jgi:putative DNA methylase
MPAQKLKPPEYVLGEHYPEATLEDGTKAPVIAWIWARTVTCPNPACGIEMPLLRSWWLSKKKGKEAWVRPIIVADADADADAGRSSGKRMKFEVGHGAVGAPAIEGHATVGRNGTTCAACGSAVDLKYLRAEGKRGALGARLLAIVAEGPRQRLYLDPASDHEMAAAVSAAPDAPDAVLATHPQYMGAPRYGMSRARDLFTDRQLLALTTFSDLVMEVRERVLRDAVAIGGSPGARLESGGTDAVRLQGVS